MSSKKRKWGVILVIAILSIAGGMLVPRFLGTPAATARSEEQNGPRDCYIPFCEVTVNLAEGRLSRYLRVKIVLSVENKQKKDVLEKLEHRKAVLKSWLIAHLSDKSLQDVTGRASMNRIRREVLDQLNSMLYPGSPGHIVDVLFEEFVVQ